MTKTLRTSYDQNRDQVRLTYFAQPLGARAVVICIQGLHGHLYDSTGSSDETGNLINRLHADLPDIAIAPMTYPWDLRRFKANETLSAGGIAHEIADALNETIFDHCHTVVILGHCLGGLLTTLALPHLLHTRVDLIHRLRVNKNRLVVFLLDSPHDLPKCRLSNFHVGLLKALRLPQAAMRENARFWQWHVLTDGPDKIPIEAYAVTSKAESWVTPLNPTAGLSAFQVCQVTISHEALVQVPMAGPFEPYDFVLERLREALP
ncbi:MAG: hypothetical protein OEY57_13255 [Nitrospirota bacterium]|nr:hypothetical protein [Nitrospirota bacterium]